MGTVDWPSGRPFPSVLHVKRGNEIKRYVPENTCRLETCSTRYQWLSVPASSRTVQRGPQEVKRSTFVILFCTLCIASIIFALWVAYVESGSVEPTEYTQTESQAPRFELHSTNINSLQVITDNQTGVQYLKYKLSGLTPLLNSDGSLLLDGEVGGPLP